MASPVAFSNHYDCGICMQNFKLPVKVLLCGHSYCGSCLAPIGGQGQIQCPQCGMVTFLSVHGVPGLTNNYALHQILRSSRPPSEMTLDFALLGPPPPVILPPQPAPSNPMHMSRSTTPEMHSVPSIQVTPTVSPISSSTLQGHGAVDLPPHSAIVVDAPANVVVGAYSMVVTDANCSVSVGKECRIFSHNPSLPQPPPNSLQVSCGHVSVGMQSSVFTAQESHISVGDNSDVWLGVGSVLVNVGPHCVWHTAVKGVYRPAHGVC